MARKILSLDGGGIRGIASLLILQQLMETIRDQKGLEETPKPCQYFDLIGGTSTGGIIAIMLGRLGMSAGECLAAYTEVAQQAFTPAPGGFKLPAAPSGAFSGDALKKAIQKIVERYTGDPETLYADKVGCKTVVLALTKDDASAAPTRFQSWKPADMYKGCKIWEIARATSAATTFFPSIPIGTMNIEFIDAGMGTNNPCSILLGDSRDIFQNEDIACLLSIGTGLEGTLEIKDGVWKGRKSIFEALKKLATNASRVHEELDGRLDPAVYFRFDVIKGLNDVTLSDWEKASKIASLASTYVTMTATARRLKECSLLVAEARTSSKNKFIVPAWQQSSFIGRRDILESIKAVMVTGHRRVALLGLGGIGKSEIARQYAYSRKGKCTVFWINAQDTHTLSQSFIFIARKLGKTAGDAQAAIEVFQNWCFEAEQSNESWLIIIDNVSSWATVKDYLPEQQNGELILTSRDRQIAEVETTLHALDVTKMNERDAEIMLVSGLLGGKHFTAAEVEEYVETEGNSSTVNKISEVMLTDYQVSNYADLRALNQYSLDSLPLAIAQCSAYLRVNQATLDDYKSGFEDRRKTLLSWSINFANYNQSIMTTWEISYEKVNNDNQQAAQILNLLGFLQPQSISHQLITNVLKPQKWWDNSIELPVLAESKRLLECIDTRHAVYDFPAALGTLSSLFLIQQDHIPGLEHPDRRKIIRIHPLVSEWIQLRLNAEDRASQVEKVLLILYSGLPPLIRSRKDQDLEMLSARVLVHTQIALRHATDLIQSSGQDWSISATCVTLFIELYLWNQGPQLLDVANTLILHIPTEEQAWLSPILAATRILRNMEQFQTVETAEWPDFQAFYDDLTLLEMSQPPAENTRAWVLWAMVSTRLCSDVRQEWTATASMPQGQAFIHNAAVDLPVDVQNRIVNTIPLSVRLFCLPAITTQSPPQSRGSAASICKAVVLFAYARFLENFTQGRLESPFANATMSYDKKSFVLECNSAMREYQEAALAAITHSIPEVDTYFVTLLDWQDRSSTDYCKTVFFILDHPVLSAHLLNNEFRYRVRPISIDTALEAMKSRNMVEDVVLQCSYQNYEHEPAVFEKCFPWTLMLATLQETAKEFKTAASLLQLHYNACVTIWGIGSVKTQKVATQLATLYKNSHWERGSEEMERAEFFKIVVENCRAGFDYPSPFTFWWHTQYFTRSSEYLDCMRQILRELPESSQLSYRQEFENMRQFPKYKPDGYERAWAELLNDGSADNTIEKPVNGNLTTVLEDIEQGAAEVRRLDPENAPHKVEIDKMEAKPKHRFKMNWLCCGR